MIKPLILSPAGSFEALKAAVLAGADEVYFGLPEFNARYNAKNFERQELEEALKMCRILGVKTNITVNTLITDKEMPRALSMVYDAACLGADAFIVQDLGFARQIKSSMPEVVMHASTQCACHNETGAKMLSELGFSRVVLAREMPVNEIEKVTKLGVETEIFVHGALCVCQSGMCLMSSVIGDRSGNRGLCAQPCRLPYSMPQGKNKYPLSLKDLSLGTRIEDILPLGITSLKIEGRMKSPEYVYKTTKIWREIVDGGKNAGKETMKHLENVFSRSGFTDKYFSGEYVKDNSDMYGIRSSGDKESTRETQKEIDFTDLTRKRKIKIRCDIREGEKIKAFAESEGVSVSVETDFVSPAASSRPVSSDEVKMSLSKLGNTYFCADNTDIEVFIQGNVFLSKAMLNSVRRLLCEELERKTASPIDVKKREINEERTKREKVVKTDILVSCKSKASALRQKGAHYVSIPLLEIKGVESLSDIKKNGCLVGVTLPRVVYSSEMKECEKLLNKAKEIGADFALVSNIGQIDAVKKSGLMLFGDIGLNVFNSSTVSLLEDLNFSLITVSPELNEAQVRDLYKDKKTKLCSFVKGCLPVMVLESCIVKANGKCSNETNHPCTVLHDRIGKDFPVYGERRLVSDGKPCRNIIYNSVETNILSKSEKMAKMNVDTGMILVLE